MIAVSDTSPLHYLVAAERESLFTRVFGEIVIPRAVQRETPGVATPWRAAMDPATATLAFHS